ncbi:MAG: FHA domain-containing protein [Armatimonadetes bacterium]|nr:FHA domain-containing protein [Armatimonadota bacterium]
MATQKPTPPSAPKKTRTAKPRTSSAASSKPKSPSKAPSSPSNRRPTTSSTSRTNSPTGSSTAHSTGSIARDNEPGRPEPASRGRSSADHVDPQQEAVSPVEVEAQKKRLSHLSEEEEERIRHETGASGSGSSQPADAQGSRDPNSPAAETPGAHDGTQPATQRAQDGTRAASHPSDTEPGSEDPPGEAGLRIPPGAAGTPPTAGSNGPNEVAAPATEQNRRQWIRNRTGRAREETRAPVMPGEPSRPQTDPSTAPGRRSWTRSGRGNAPAATENDGTTPRTPGAAPQPTSSPPQPSAAPTNGTTTPEQQSQILQELRRGYSQRMQQLARDNPEALEGIFRQSFPNINEQQLQDHLQAARDGQPIQPPNVRFVEGSTLNGAQGAYSSENGGTVLLNQDLAGNRETLSQIYSEETGHFIDERLGGPDSAGDEGEIFSRGLATGRPISPAELGALRADQDRGNLRDGRAVEFASTTGLRTRPMEPGPVGPVAPPAGAEEPVRDFQPGDGIAPPAGTGEPTIRGPRERLAAQGGENAPPHVYPQQAEQAWQELERRIGAPPYPWDPASLNAFRQMSPAIQNQLQVGPRHGPDGQRSLEHPTHETNRFYATQYFTAGTDAERQAALAGLRREVNSGQNGSALSVYQNLSLVDGVRQLDAARNPAERQTALENLARMEVGQRRGQVLDDMPRLNPAEVAQARAQVQGEVRAAERAAAHEMNILRTSTDPAARSAAMERLRQIADVREQRFGTDDYRQGVQYFEGVTGAQGMQAAIARSDHAGAAQQLESLRQSSADNPQANRMVEALGGRERTQQLLEQLRSQNPATRDQAMAELQRGLSQGPIADELRIGGFRSAEDVLNHANDPQAVARAREAADRFERENFTRAQTALDQFISRESTPELRQQALRSLQAAHGERLAQLRSNSFGHTMQWAEAVHAARTISETDDPHAAAQAMEQLRGMAPGNTVAADMLRRFQSNQNVRGATQALTGNDQAARNRAIDRLGANLPGGRAQAQRLAQDLGSSEEAVRDRARQQLESAVSSQGSPSDTARELGQRLQSEDPAVRQAALQELRQTMPDGTRELNDYRVRQALRGLDGNSNAQQFQQAFDSLQREQARGNQFAQDWMPWASAHHQAARITEAPDLATAGNAVANLRRMAEGGDPYARRLLSSVLLQQAGPPQATPPGPTGSGARAPGDGPAPARAGGAQQRPQDPLLNDWYGEGHGEVNGRPVFAPSLRSNLSLQDQSRLQLQAADALASAYQQPHVPLERADAAALGMGLAHAHASNSPELQQRLNGLFDRFIGSSQSQAAMDGLFDAMRYGPQGATNLADVYLRGAQNPTVRNQNIVNGHFETFRQGVWTGHEASTRVMAGLTGNLSGQDSHAGMARRTLEQAADNPVLREGILNQMVHTYNRYGDGHSMLATMGTVASREGAIPDSVRQALHSGVTSSTEGLQTAQAAFDRFGASPDWSNDGVRRAWSQLEAARRTHQSALGGMMNMANRWENRDVDALTQRVSPELAGQLTNTIDRIPADQRRHLIDRLNGKIEAPNSADGGQQRASMRALGVMGAHLTNQDVDRISSFGQNQQVSADLRADAGRTLLNVLARTSDPAVGTRLGGSGERPGELLSRHWGSLQTDATRERDWQALVNYAQGRPLDPRLQEQVVQQIYDAGLPRPVASIFRDWGAPGDAAAVAQQAQQASQHYGNETVRRVASRVAMLNSLPPQLRRELTGSADPLNTQQIAGQLANGSLGREGASNGFLLDRAGGGGQTLEQRVEQLRLQANRDSYALEQQRRQLTDQRQSEVRALGAQTREGIDFLDRVGYLFGSDRIDNYAREQRTRVREISRLDSELQRVSAEQHQLTTRDADGNPNLGPQSRATFLGLAQDVTRHQDMLNQGRTREADIMALDMYRTHGPIMERHAPSVWRELTRNGENPLDRGSWQRLHQIRDSSGQPMTMRDRMPVYPTDAQGRLTPQGFQQAVADLRQASAAGNALDRAAIRENALRATAADPSITALAQGAAVFGDQLPVLQEMFQAGVGGTKYEDFVRNARERAGALQTVLNNAPAHLGAARDRMAAMQTAFDAMPDGPEKEALRSQMDGLRGAMDLLTPGTQVNNTMNYMVQSIQSENFDANTFANWVRQEGPALAVGLAAAVAAGALIVGTGGLATPAVIAAAAAGSGAFLVGSEATSEGLYHLRQHTGLNIGSGRSRLGAWVGGDTILDPNSFGGRRQAELGRDVAMPYAQQFARDFVIGLATMGLARGAGSLFSRLGSGVTALGSTRVGGAVLNRVTPAMQRLAERTGALQRMVAGNPAQQGALRGFMREYASEGFEEALETAGEAGLSRAVNSGNEYLGFASTAMLAMSRAGLSLGRRGTGGNITFDAPNAQAAMDVFRQEGHTVQDLGNHQYRVTTYDGRAFTMQHVAGAPPLTADAPPAGATSAPPAGTSTPPAGTSTPPVDTRTPPAATNTPPVADPVRLDRDTTDIPPQRMEAIQRALRAGNREEAVRLAQQTGIAFRSLSPSDIASILDGRGIPARGDRGGQDALRDTLYYDNQGRDTRYTPTTEAPPRFLDQGDPNNYAVLDSRRMRSEGRYLNQSEMPVEPGRQQWVEQQAHTMAIGDIRPGDMVEMTLGGRRYSAQEMQALVGRVQRFDNAVVNGDEVHLYNERGDFTSMSVADFRRAAPGVDMNALDRGNLGIYFDPTPPGGGGGNIVHSLHTGLDQGGRQAAGVPRQPGNPDLSRQPGQPTDPPGGGQGLTGQPSRLRVPGDRLHTEAETYLRDRGMDPRLLEGVQIHTGTDPAGRTIESPHVTREADGTIRMYLPADTNGRVSAHDFGHELKHVVDLQQSATNGQISQSLQDANAAARRLRDLRAQGAPPEQIAEARRAYEDSMAEHRAEAGGHDFVDNYLERLQAQPRPSGRPQGPALNRIRERQQAERDRHGRRAEELQGSRPEAGARPDSTMRLDRDPESGQPILRTGDNQVIRVPTDGSPIMVGRRPGDGGHVVNNPMVSGRHAELKYENGQLMVRDAGSTNGTFVDGQRIPPGEWRAVPANGRLRFGPLEGQPGREVPQGDAPPAGARPADVAPPAARRPDAAAPAPAPFRLNAPGGLHWDLPADGSPRAFGRDPGEGGVQLGPENDRVSRRHAELRYQDGQLQVRDLGSRNGTFVNGSQIGGDWVSVPQGGRVSLGNQLNLTGAAARPRVQVPPLETGRPTQMTLADGRTALVQRAANGEVTVNTVQDTVSTADLRGFRPAEGGGGLGRMLGRAPRMEMGQEYIGPTGARQTYLGQDASGRHLFGSTHRYASAENLQRHLDKESDRQGLRDGPLTEDYRLGGGNVNSVRHGTVRRPDGSAQEVAVVQRPSAHRARNEIAADHLNTEIGFTNRFPATVARDGNIVQEFAGTPFERSIRELAHQRYGSSSSESVVRLMNEDPAVRRQVEEAFAERLVYGDGDNHANNFVMTHGPNGVEVRNIDLDFAFPGSEPVPTWQQLHTHGVNRALHGHFSEAPINEGTRQRLNDFASRYATPQAQAELARRTGLSPEQIAGVVSRARWMGESGRFPRAETMEEMMQRHEGR